MFQKEGAEARARVAEAELSAESAVSCAGGTAKNIQTESQGHTNQRPDIGEFAAVGRESLDSAEPSEDTHHAARDDAQPPTPEEGALLYRLQEHAAEVDRCSSKVDSLNARLISKTSN